MSRKRGTKQASFLQQYNAHEDFLLPPDPGTGRPGLIRGATSNGREVVIKVWSRGSAQSVLDIEEIWRSEIRQLQRLAAVPRADDLLVPMVASGSDPSAFYLVLDTHGGDLLEVYRGAQKLPPLLTSLNNPRLKRAAWGNILRLAQAVQLLHSQVSGDTAN